MHLISYFERVVKAYSCRVTRRVKWRVKWRVTRGVRVSNLTIAML